MIYKNNDIFVHKLINKYDIYQDYSTKIWM